MAVDSDFAASEVLQAEQARCEATETCDWERLEALLDGDLTWTHMSGRIEDKATYMTRAMTRRERLRRHELKVHVFGCVGVMNGQISVTPILESGEGEVLEAAMLQVWVKRDDSWLLHSVALTRFPTPPVRLL